MKERGKGREGRVKGYGRKGKLGEGKEREGILPTSKSWLNATVRGYTILVFIN